MSKQTKPKSTTPNLTAARAQSLEKMRARQGSVPKAPVPVAQSTKNPVGRPRTVGDGVARSVVITREQDDAITALAQRDGLAWSAALRKVLAQWVQGATA